MSTLELLADLRATRDVYNDWVLEGRLVPEVGAQLQAECDALLAALLSDYGDRVYRTDAFCPQPSPDYCRNHRKEIEGAWLTTHKTSRWRLHHARRFSSTLTTRRRQRIAP